MKIHLAEHYGICFGVRDALALAERIAQAIQAKSGLEQPAGASVETFLEATASQLRDQARMQ